VAVADVLRRLTAISCIRARRVPDTPRVRSYSTDKLPRPTSITITCSSCCVLSSLFQCLSLLFWLARSMATTITLEPRSRSVQTQERREIGIMRPPTIGEASLRVGDMKIKTESQIFPCD
jgi:hypothetical protein